jgi:integrase
MLKKRSDSGTTGGFTVSVSEQIGSRPQEREPMPRAVNGEGSIYPEKVAGEETGRWIAQMTVAVVNGRQRYSRKIFDSERKASAGLKKMTDERDQGIVSSTATVSVYLTDYMEHHLPQRRGGTLSKSTLENYTYSANHITERIGTVRIDRLTPQDVENKLLRPMAKKGLSRSTIMRTRLVLSLALAHATSRGEVARNVAELATIPHTEPRGPRKSLSAKQAAALLKAARTPTGNNKPERMEAAIVTQLMLGLRPGELLGLKWSDLNGKGDVLQIQRTTKREDGKLILGDTKTEASNRPLRLPKPVRDALKAHKARQREERKHAEPWEDNDLIFPTSTGRLMERQAYRTTLQRIMRKAAINGEWTSHELRHSAASLLAEAGVPLEAIADQLGHVDTRMIQRTYRHRLGKPVDASVEVMDALFA